MRMLKIRRRFSFRQHDAVHAGPHRVRQIGIDKRLVDAHVDGGAALVRLLYRFADQGAATLFFGGRYGVLNVEDVDVTATRPGLVDKARIGGRDKHRYAGDAVVHDGVLACAVVLASSRACARFAHFK